MTGAYAPHLTLHKAQPRERRVDRRHGQRVRSTGVIRYRACSVIPGLAVAVERAMPVAVEADILATEYPRRRLILVAYWERVGQPVGDVCAPLHGWHGQYLAFYVIAESVQLGIFF